MRSLATSVMNCDYTAKVSLLIDGELFQQEADEIRDHIRTCHACWQTLEDFLHLRQEIKAHQFATDPIGQRQALREIFASNQPARPSARRREWLANTFVAPRYSPALTAALILMAIGITLTVTSYRGSHRNAPVHEFAEHTGNSNAVPPLPSASGSATPDVAPKRSVEIALNNKSDEAVSRSTKTDRSKIRPVANKTPKSVSEQPRVVGNKGTPQQLVREAEQKYQAAIVLLGRDVNRSQIDPIALAQFERTLTAIDQAIADTRRAVRANPDDPVAVQYMLSAYAKKVEVLEEMTTARRTP